MLGTDARSSIGILFTFTAHNSILGHHGHLGQAKAIARYVLMLHRPIPHSVEFLTYP